MLLTEEACAALVVRLRLGPSRELDMDIFRVVSGYAIDEDGWINSPHEGHIRHFAPRYTWLLDAAMGLMPELLPLHRPISLTLSTSGSGTAFSARLENWAWGPLDSGTCLNWPTAAAAVLLRARLRMQP